MKIYNRKSKQIVIVKQYKEKVLNFLYGNIFGRIVLKIIINPFFSKIYGLYNSLWISKYKIKKWIKKYNIDMNKYEQKKYKNFNDFFVRKLCLNKTTRFQDFISPCEGNLTVYKITEDLKINIKNSTYTLNELFETNNLDDYKNGWCFLYHLTVDCYHRYCFIDDGIMLNRKKIKGKLHTVSSISKNYKIYKENSREYELLETNNFGKILVMEVGALLVGKINNNNVKIFKKGMEKGYFELGGSSIVILVSNNKVKIDKDILKYSDLGIPVKVEYMEKVGVKND